MTERFHYLYPVTARQVEIELAREAEQRERFYPRRVADLKMTKDEAAAQLAAVAAWREDVARMLDFERRAAEAFRQLWTAGAPARPTVMAEATHGLDWRARRMTLQREINLRERHYPGWVQSLRLSQADADHRQDCLRALAARYDDGFDWRASNGACGMLPILARTPEEKIAAEEWREHMDRILAERAPDRQKELAI